jgi:hypothetical protein
VVLNFWRFHPVPSINSRATLNPRRGEQIAFGAIGMVAVTLRCTPARRLRVRSSAAVAVCGGRERRAQRRYRPRRHSLVAARLCITPPLAAMRRPREEHQRRWAGFGAIALILLLFDAACAKAIVRPSLGRYRPQHRCPTNAIPGPSPRSHGGSADISLHSVHVDELEWQMKVAVIILNPTFLVFIQLVAT